MKPDPIRRPPGTNAANGPVGAPQPAPARPEDRATPPATPPRMRQPVREGLYIDSDDDSSSDDASPAAKRGRPENGGQPEPHGEPEFKRRRTVDPSQGARPAGSDTGSLAAPVSSSSVPPTREAHNWRDTLRLPLTTQDLDWLSNDNGAHPGRCYELLFGHPPMEDHAGPYVFVHTPPLGPALEQQLAACGAVALGVTSAGSLLTLYASDFDRARFRTVLLTFQAQEAAGNVARLADGRRNTSALHLACQWADEPGVRLLLERGADVNIRDGYGTTPLMQAIGRGHTAIVQQLCEHPGIDFAIEDAYRRNALSYAMHGGLKDICGLVLSHAHSTANEFNDPLLIAATRGHLELCQILLEQGFATRVDKKGPDDHTALAHAARAGHLACCKLLREHGASVAWLTPGRHTLLGHAAASGNLALFDYLLSQGAPLLGADFSNGESALDKARQLNHVALLKRLSESGVSINLCDTQLRTRLTLACMVNNGENAARLLQQGANPNIVDADGKSALIYAADHGNAKLVSLLIEHGAALGFPEHLGFKALSAAVIASQVEVVAVMLKAGVAPDLPKRSLPVEPTALLLACFKSPTTAPRRTELLTLLLKAGAPLRVITNAGNDPLMLAISAGDSSAIQLLLQYGAEIGQTNLKNENALDLILSPLDKALATVDRNPHPGPARDAARKIAALVAHDLAKVSLATSRQSKPRELMWTASSSAAHPLTRELILLTDLWLDNDQANLISRAKHSIALKKLTAGVSAVSLFGQRVDRQRVEHKLAYADLPMIATHFLTPYYLALPAMTALIFGSDPPKPESKVVLSAVAGMCASLERLDRQSTSAMPMYERLGPLVMKHKLTGESMQIHPAERLSLIARTKVEALVEYGIAHEANVMAPLFESLLETCAEATWPAGEPKRFAPQFAPRPDAIARKLLDAGVYWALAKPLDAAWAAAWSAVSAAGVPDDQAAGLLEQSFRAELQARANSVDTRILNPVELPPEHAGVYADLMHRQLHLLTQFIDGSQANDGETASHQTSE